MVEPRIPLALQKVILASNRGEDVHQPPPGTVANQVYKAKPKFALRRPRFWTRKTKRTTNDHKSHNAKEFEENSHKTNSTQGTTASAELSLCERTSVDGCEQVNPQELLDRLLRERGYSTQRFAALKTAYYNRPTPLQEASYDVHLIGVVKRGDIDELEAILKSGISPNPCNNFGESLLHLICRCGNEKLLAVMLDHCACLQVSDDYGRTPLHDACWSTCPNFDLIEMILDRDPSLLFVVDARGSPPVEYLQKQFWSQWSSFILRKVDTYWPQLAKGQLPPVCPRAQQKPDSCPVPDPVDALSPKIARMVVSARLSPEEAIILQGPDEASSDSSSSTFDCDFSGHTFASSEGSCASESLFSETEEVSELSFSVCCDNDDDTVISGFSGIQLALKKRKTPSASHKAFASGTFVSSDYTSGYSTACPDDGPGGELLYSHANDTPTYKSNEDEKSFVSLTRGKVFLWNDKTPASPISTFKSSMPTSKTDTAHATPPSPVVRKPSKVDRSVGTNATPKCKDLIAAFQQTAKLFLPPDYDRRCPEPRKPVIVERADYDEELLDCSC